MQTAKKSNPKLNSVPGLLHLLKPACIEKRLGNRLASQSSNDRAPMKNLKYEDMRLVDLLEGQRAVTSRAVSLPIYPQA
jgi:hypothetical protein